MNFAWVYSREAHPEEFPFAPGFETRDQGWDHRYFNTTTMEQRAQRARWIKTDLEPDAELPIRGPMLYHRGIDQLEGGTWRIRRNYSN